MLPTASSPVSQSTLRCQSSVYKSVVGTYEWIYQNKQTDLHELRRGEVSDETSGVTQDLCVVWSAAKEPRQTVAVEDVLLQHMSWN